MVAGRRGTGRRAERGAAALEFALTVPVVLALLLGGLDYGFYLLERIVLTQAVGEGARAAALARPWRGEDPARAAREAVRAAFWPRDLPADLVRVERLAPDPGRALPERLRVSVEELSYEPVVGYLPEDLLPRRLAAAALAVLP